MKFSQLAEYFEKISKNTSRLEITRILAELFKKLSPSEIEKVVYLLQGRVRPAYEGIEFGMAEKMVIKAIILALNIEKSYFEKEYKKTGDLGETVEYFKKQFFSFEEKEMEVDKVYDFFYRIATSSGDGSQEVKTSLLSQLIRQLDPISAKFIVRIPTGNIRMGFSDMTILDGYSWMITGDKSLRNLFEKAYHVRPELGFIGRLVKEKGVADLEKIEPKVFTPIIMMRAERLSSAKEIIDQLGDCVIEEKFDGFRLQVHYKKGTVLKGSVLEKTVPEVKLFSRSLEDVTFMYPDIVEAVKKQVKAKEMIFEGEAIGYNPKTGNFLPFQETVQRKRKYDIDKVAKEIPLRLFVFELLYKDGENFINQPFIKRRKILEESIETKKDIKNEVILIANQEKISDEKKLDELFDKAVKNNLEGIMAKKINGVYKPGAREWNWIKYKKSYSSKVNDTIDCVVMGYDLGKGKRTSFGIGAFLVGVYDDKNDQYKTVAKIGTGLTDEEWKKLKVKSQSASWRTKIQKKPSSYLVDKTMECDIWLEPKIVVEIRADEITKSPVHTAGYALRFPRLERFRDDKKPQEATTLTELLSMANKHS